MAITLGACSFHSKQPVDETYYKRSQSVAWPEAQPVTVAQPVVQKQVQQNVNYTNANVGQVPGNAVITVSGVNPETGQPYTATVNMNAMGFPVQSVQ